MMGGPKIQHLDDVSLEEMLHFEFADGRTASICKNGSRCLRVTSRFGTSGTPVQ
jgi:hypothetical protein